MTACPVCGATTEHYWDRVWSAAGKTVRRCTGCGLFHVDPLPTPDEQKAFDAQYDAYIAKREEAVAPHVDSAFVELVDDSIEERYSDIADYFQGASSVLEIGAERGGFLKRLSRDAGRLVGVDPCPEYTDAIRALGFEGYAYIFDVPRTERFDRICFFSLLEHILEPGPFLGAVRDRLADGGRVIAEVPSAADPLLSVYDVPAFKDFYFQAMHPFVYSVEAVRRMFDDAGLKIVETRPKQRYGLANHLQWLRKGVPGGSVDFDSLFGHLNDAYVKALEADGRTDTVYVVAERK